MASKLLDKKAIKDVRENITPYNANELAEKYDVTVTTIRNAVMGRHAYKYVTEPQPKKTWVRQLRKDGFSKESMLEVVKKYHERESLGLTIKEIGEQYGISESYVSRIVNEQLYENA